MKKLLLLILLSLFFLSACFNNETNNDLDDMDLENNNQNGIEDDPSLEDENNLEQPNEQENNGQEEAGEDTPPVEDQENGAEESDKEEGTETADTAEITPNDAENLVKQRLGLEHNPDIHVRFDHEDEQGRYLIQVYESVGEGETAHTATIGWYYVDKQTGEITDL